MNNDFMDYWIYHMVWEDRDVFDEDQEHLEQETLERETLERESKPKFYDNNTSKGNSREY